MFRTNVIIFWMILATKTAHAQMITGLDKDSLKNLMIRMPYDTNRVLVNIVLGQQYESSDPDSALFYYFEAGKLSKKLNYPAGIIKYISNYTAVLNVQGKVDESIRLNEEAADISEKYGMKLYAGKSYVNLGAAYQYQENYLKAAEYYLKALPLIERHGNLQMQAVLLANLCGLYRNLNQPDKAIDYALRALKTSVKFNDAYLEGHSSINLGIFEFGPVLQGEFRVSKRGYFTPHIRIPYLGILYHVTNWDAESDKVTVSPVALGWEPVIKVYSRHKRAPGMSVA